MQAHIEARAQLENALRLGFARNEFMLYYQPQVNQYGQTTGAEALLRWQSPSAAWCRRPSSFRWPKKWD
jgi:EAL domain-containing protein (putative c-di-GMP-specific phosphodiesterase class I)